MKKKVICLDFCNTFIEIGKNRNKNDVRRAGLLSAEHFLKKLGAEDSACSQTRQHQGMLIFALFSLIQIHCYSAKLYCYGLPSRQSYPQQTLVLLSKRACFRAFTRSRYEFLLCSETSLYSLRL